MINEPFPFEPGYYSHKFHRAGVRYELGVSIQSGDIVWLNGPFPCGRFADQKIAKDEGLEDVMDPGEATFVMVSTSTWPLSRHRMD